MRLPSPAMVVACVALVVALSGTGYAAVQLSRNSVGATQIRPAAVRSSEVKDRSLRARDFARGQLPRGATGAAGAVGPAGPAGPTGATGPAGPSALEVAVPAARATRPLAGPAQSIPSATSTKLDLTAEEYDTGAVHGAGTFTAPRAGLYLVEGFARWAINGSASRQIAVEVGGEYASDTTIPAAPGFSPTTTSVAAVVRLAQGQTAQLKVQQNTGGSLDVFGAAGSMTYLGKTG